MLILKASLPAVLMLLGFTTSATLHFGASPALAKTTADNSLFGLASSSDFGIVGTVSNTTGVRKRLSPEELVKLADLSKALGGTIYKIHIDEVVTRRSDFGKGRSSTSFPNGDLFIFRRRDAPYFPNEFYELGQRYLIFVNQIANQTALQKSYELEPKTTYYQAFDPNQGIVRLKSIEDPLVLKFRQLGQAIQPPDLNKKLQRLKILTRSRDPELGQMAEEAIKLIQHKMRE